MNWKGLHLVVCPIGHVNIVEKGEHPKFCYECGLKIDYSKDAQKIRKCKDCGRPLTKSIGKLGNGLREEYKDTGLCVQCWVRTHKEELEIARVQIEDNQP